MPANNRSAHPFYIIAGTMVCLFGLSVVSKNISVKGLSIRQVDMLADIRRTIPAPAPAAPPVALIKPAPPADTIQAVVAPVVRPASPHLRLHDLYRDPGIPGFHRYEQRPDALPQRAPGPSRP